MAKLTTGKRRSSNNLLEVQNAAKTMFANIRFQSIDDPIKSIVITSTVPNEGKTTTMWYLAQAAATAGNRVLIVESDMRRRSIAKMLNLHSRYGIRAVLTGECPLDKAVMQTSVDGLYFLDAEPSIPNPADLLASKSMRNFHERLKGSYDYIMFDTPPVGTFVDAAVLGSITDGTILVVRPNSVRRAELLRAKEQLDSAGANIIGICSTFVEGTGSEYYYSYYTKEEDTSNAPAPVDAAPAPARPQVPDVPVKAVPTPKYPTPFGKHGAQ